MILGKQSTYGRRDESSRRIGPRGLHGHLDQVVVLPREAGVAPRIRANAKGTAPLVSYCRRHEGSPPRT